jgi:hypothetical protein
MHDKPHDKPQETPFNPAVHPLKQLSAEQFAALGAQSVVYRRQIDAGVLDVLMPGTGIDPKAGTLNLLVSADGTPVLVTDNTQALEDWVDERDITLAMVH